MSPDEMLLDPLRKTDRDSGDRRDGACRVRARRAAPGPARPP